MLGPVNTNWPDYVTFQVWNLPKLNTNALRRICHYSAETSGFFNRQVLNAILYVAEQGCKWRGLPARFGNWHTIYTRMNRWSKNGVLDGVFEQLQREQIVRIRLEAVSMDSTSVKVHPDGTGALKKTVPNPSASLVAVGPPRFIWFPRMLERPSPSRSRLDKPTTPRKDVNC